MDGRTLIHIDDHLCGLESFGFRRNVLQEFYENVFIRHRFAFPHVNYNLTNPDGVFILSEHSILFALFYLFPAFTEEVAVFIVTFRLWLAGASFLAYCLQNNMSGIVVGLGGIVYIGSQFPFMCVTTQNGFLTMMIMFPLMAIGAEQLMKHKRTPVLALCVFYELMVSFFLAWYCLIALGVFCLCHLLFNGTSFIEKIECVFQLCWHILLGSGLRAFALIPYIIALGGTSRIGTTSTRYSIGLFSYGADNWVGIWRNLFFNNGAALDIVNSSWFGLPSITMPALLYFYFFIKKQRALKLLFPLTLVLMSIPLFGLLSGLSDYTDRWSFLLPFCVALITVKAIPNLLKEKDRRRLQLLFGLSFTIVLTYLIDWLTNNNQTAGLSALGLVICLVATSFAQRLCLYEAVSYCTVFSIGMLTPIIINALYLETDDFTEKYLVRGNLESTYQSYIDYAATDIKDEEPFYRIEKSDCVTEISCNMPWLYGYNGISSFTNVIHPDVFRYYHDSGNSGIWQVNKASDLDGRVTDELLAGVKYFLCPLDYKIIPYGFVPFMAQAGNGDYSIYVNENTLPIAYAYDHSVDYNFYKSLNIAEQQELLLKSVILENTDKNESDGNVSRWDLLSREVPYQIIDTNKVEYLESNGKQSVTSKKNGFMTIRAKVPEESELYIALDGIRPSAGTVITAKLGERTNSVKVGKKSSTYANHQSFTVLNLGSGIKGDQEITLTFSKKISVEDISCYARKLGMIKTDVAALCEETLENISIETNKISGDVRFSTAKWLCFSLPYSKNWTCLVDGEEMELVKANLMYTAVRLPEGNHHVEMHYYPVGRKAGFVVSGLFLIIMLFYLPPFRRLIKIPGEKAA